MYKGVYDTFARWFNDKRGGIWFYSDPHFGDQEMKWMRKDYIGDDEQVAERKGQVGSGDRSERIRTYNFPQGRVTDHRIGMTIYKLDSFMDGDLDDIIDALITSDQAEKMKNS